MEPESVLGSPLSLLQVAFSSLLTLVCIRSICNAELFSLQCRQNACTTPHTTRDMHDTSREHRDLCADDP